MNETPIGEAVDVLNKVKDLGVPLTNNLLFKEHIDNIMNTSQTIMGILQRTFSTRA